MPEYKFERKRRTDQDEIRGMLEACRFQKIRALIIFLYLFGCRVSEALGLTKEDIWIEGKYLCARIGILKRKDRPRGPYKDIPHILRVGITSPFISNFVQYYNTIGKELLIFPFSRQLAWLRMKETNKKISPHVFRHDRLMKLAMKGASESELQDWAGWTDTRPASNYIQPTGRLASKFADEIE